MLINYKKKHIMNTEIEEINISPLFNEILSERGIGEYWSFDDSRIC